MKVYALANTHVHRLKFDLLALPEMSRIKTKNHKLRGDVFSVEFDNSSPVFTQDDGTDKNASGTEQCTIEVKSIPRVIAVEVLEMYFENSRSGGSKDCVEEIKIIDSETAHVIFHTPEGLFIRLFLLNYIFVCSCCLRPGKRKSLPVQATFGVAICEEDTSI